MLHQRRPRRRVRPHREGPALRGAVRRHRRHASLLPRGRRRAYAAIDQGLATDTLWVDGGLRNYGWIAGVLGNVGPLDYRGRVQVLHRARSCPRSSTTSTTGSAAPTPSGSPATPSTPRPTSSTCLTMGIYGEAGWTWEKVFSFSVGYLWPFTIDGGAWKPAEMDYLHAEAKLERGVIPFVNIAAAIAYDRYFLVPDAARRQGERRQRLRLVRRQHGGQEHALVRGQPDTSTSSSSPRRRWPATPTGT